MTNKQAFLSAFTIWFKNYILVSFLSFFFLFGCEQRNEYKPQTEESEYDYSYVYNPDEDRNLNIIYNRFLDDHKKENYKKTVKDLFYLADRNHTNGLRVLGMYYYRGFGVPQDYREALKYHLKAAERGSVDSMSDAAHMFSSAEGVWPYDYESALDWGKKAGLKGNVKAQKLVGSLYDKKFEKTKDGKDRNYSYAWYNLAASSGDEEAKKWIKNCFILPLDLIKAQALSTDLYEQIDS